MNPPGVRQALALSARAVGRALWLAPVGFLFAFLARGATAPAGLFLAAMAGRGAWAGAAQGDGASAVLTGVAAALLAPRTLYTALGLWLAGLLLRGALRVLWLSGALPALGEALSGREAPAFASGAAWGYRRMLGTALLGAMLEWTAAAAAVGAVAGALALSARLMGSGGGHAGAALLVAAALTAAAAVPLAAGILAEAALARTALRGEPPLSAFVAAAVRFGHRPAAFAAAALCVGVGALVVGGSAEVLAASAVQVAATQVPGALLVVPELAAAVFGAMAAALLELWRLGAVGAMACHGAPGDP